MRALVVFVCVLMACGRVGFDALSTDGGGDGSVVIDGGVFVGSTATYVKASNTGQGDNFGAAIAISGDGRTLAIAAFTEASASAGDQNDNTAVGAGAVYVFVRSGTTWTQQAYLKAAAPDAMDTFGTSIALSDDGNTLAVGALGEDGSGQGVNPTVDNNRIDAGAVYTYRRTGNAWDLDAYIKAPNSREDDAFGQVVALSGDGTTLVVGAPYEDSGARGVGPPQSDANAVDSGAVYVYEKFPSGWAFQAYLKPSNTSPDISFGDALALSADGSTIAVGAYLEANSATGIDPVGQDQAAIGAGAVYVFARTGGSWVQQSYMKSPNAESGDQFGICVSLSTNGSIMVVGAHLEDSSAHSVNGSQSDNTAVQSGAAYVIERSAGVWSHRAYLKASNSTADTNFGLRCSISGDGSELVVGAINEASASGGVNADQTDRSMPGAGAAYVFGRGVDTRSWTQTAYVKATSPGMFDNFATVELSSDGRTLIVGAYLEDSMATGIGGDSTNNARPNSGAAYIYE